MVLVGGPLLLTWLVLRHQLGTPIDVGDALIGDLRPGDAVPDRARLYRCLGVLTVVMVAFGLHTILYGAPSVVTFASLCVAWLYVWLRYFVIGS